MAGESIRVGDVEIVSLTDGGNEAALADFFPHHGPEDWTAFPDYVDEHGKLAVLVHVVGKGRPILRAMMGEKVGQRRLVAAVRQRDNLDVAHPYALACHEDSPCV